MALVEAAIDLLRSLQKNLVASQLVLTPALEPEKNTSTKLEATENPAYVNAVVRFESNLSPEALLSQLHEIEAHFGRTRSVRWANRTLDLDLIACVQDGRLLECTSEKLNLPHPAYLKRAFVLYPLLEVHRNAPGFPRATLEAHAIKLETPKQVLPPKVEVCGAEFLVLGALDKLDAAAALGQYLVKNRVVDYVCKTKYEAAGPNPSTQLVLLEPQSKFPFDFGSETSIELNNFKVTASGQTLAYFSVKQTSIPH